MFPSQRKRVQTNPKFPSNSKLAILPHRCLLRFVKGIKNMSIPLVRRQFLSTHYFLPSAGFITADITRAVSFIKPHVFDQTWTNTTRSQQRQTGVRNSFFLIPFFRANCYLADELVFRLSLIKCQPWYCLKLGLCS